VAIAEGVKKRWAKVRKKARKVPDNESVGEAR